MRMNSDRGLIKCGRGFTLIELLITIGILGSIGLVIIASFAGGFKVYEKIRTLQGTKTDILLSLEKMERDIRGALNFSEINFIGDEKITSFSGLVRTKKSKTGQEISLGRILYYVKGREKSLVREEQSYSKNTSEIKKGRGSLKTLAFVDGVNFSYYYFNQEDEKYEWKDSWGSKEEPEDKNKIPLGVKIKIKYKDSNESITLSRTVLIPMAVSGLGK